MRFCLLSVAAGLLLLGPASDGFSQTSTLCDDPLIVQDSPVARNFSPRTKVVADEDSLVSIDLLCIKVLTADFYRLRARVGYDADQLNEGFFLMVCNEDSAVCPVPCDHNAGPFKLVTDPQGVSDTLVVDAGVFFLEPGNYIVSMNHYKRIADTYPQFLTGGGFVGAESVHLVRVEVGPNTTAFDVALQQTTSGPIVLPDEEFSFILTIKNVSPETVNDLVLWSTIPDMVAPTGFPSFAPDTLIADTLFWRFASIPPQQEIQVPWNAKLIQLPGSAPSMFTSFSAVSGFCDVNEQNNFSQASVILPPIHDLALSKTADVDSILEGNAFHYTLEIQNNGPYVARSITLQDILPSEVSPSDFSVLPNTAASDTLFWQIDSLAVSEIFSVSFRVNVDPSATTVSHRLLNSATVLSPNETNPSNDSTTVVVDLIPRKADLVLSKTVTRDSVLTEEPFAFTLTVTNQGPNTAFDVTLNDFLPPGVTAFGFDSPPDQTVGDTLRWHLDSLAVGAAFQVGFRARVTQTPPTLPAGLVNKAQVQTASEVDDSDNSASAVVTVIPRRADLVVTKTASPDSVLREEPFAFTLTVTNQGPNTAFDVTLNDFLPPGVTAFGFDSPPDQTVGDTLRWHLDSLAVGAAFQVRFQARVTQAPPSLPADLVNRALAQTDSDTDGDNNSAVAVVKVIPRRYDLVLVQTATPDSIPKQGQFSARLTVENRGPDTAFDVQVRDILPEHAAAFDFNVNPGQTSRDTLSWHLDSLAVGATFEVTYSARAASDIPFTPFELMAQGTVEAAFDLNRANNSDEAVVVVMPSNDCLYLDRNVFLPERGTPLNINFEIGSDRFVRLDLYDVSGEHVSDLAKTDFSAGTHTYAWDGRDDDGKEVGSGVYLITLRAGNLICWTKVIVVR